MHSQKLINLHSLHYCPERRCAVPMCDTSRGPSGWFSTVYGAAPIRTGLFERPIIRRDISFDVNFCSAQVQLSFFPLSRCISTRTLLQRPLAWQVHAVFVARTHVECISRNMGSSKWSSLMITQTSWLLWTTFKVQDTFLQIQTISWSFF